MSKVSTPRYLGGSVRINGQEVASAKKVGGQIVSDYNMTGYDKAIYDYAQQALYEGLGQVNYFSPETLASLQNSVDAYTNKGIGMINGIYEPMFTSTKNDMAARFGNYDNSMFLDRLNKIDANRAAAINSLVQDVLTYQQQLYANEMAQRYQSLDFMNQMQQMPINNALAYMGLAANNSAAGNQYAWQTYNAQYQAQQAQQQQYAQLSAAILGALGGGFGGPAGATLGATLGNAAAGAASAAFR